MCNIAGYNGNRAAAPILIDMLRREAIYDGGFSTGIVTVHEGKFYWRKVIGTVDDLLEQTDALSLPGTIGLAHSRPYNDHLFNAHPHISLDGQLALVENGTEPKNDISPRRDEIANMLYEQGYDFLSKQSPLKKNFPVLKTGEAISNCELIVNLTADYMKKGYSLAMAHAKASGDLYLESVSAILCKDISDYISVCRISRPLELLVSEGESYIASTRFAFPEDVAGETVSLPVLRACKINKGGYELTQCKVESDGICEITPLTYIKAYNYAEKMLAGGKENPCIYDDLELAFKDMPELWDSEKRYSQYAKLAYDMLWQFHKEGRLQSFIAPQTLGCGTRDVAYMYLNK